MARKVENVEPWKAYSFTPIGDIDVAPFVPRGIHRVSEIDKSEAGRDMFRVVGSKRWHGVDMFRIHEAGGEMVADRALRPSELNLGAYMGI